MRSVSVTQSILQCPFWCVWQHIQRVNKQNFGRGADSSRGRWHPSNASALGLIPSTTTFQERQLLQEPLGSLVESEGSQVTRLVCLSDVWSADTSEVPGLPCLASFPCRFETYWGSLCTVELLWVTTYLLLSLCAEVRELSCLYPYSLAFTLKYMNYAKANPYQGKTNNINLLV